MSEELDIQSELTLLFPALKDSMRVSRARRIWVEAPADKVREVFDCLVSRMGFGILCTITGLDQGATLGAIYHLARESGVVVNLATRVPREKPVLQTVTEYFPTADAYERELVDLLGFKIEGLAEGHRYPLPDGWPEGQYPLRKDWKASMLEPTTQPAEGANDA